MRRFRSLGTTSLALAIAAGACTTASAQTRPIDVERSTVTVLVYKSGLFSAFADNHVIRAPISRGTIADEPPGIDVMIRADGLRVLDPDLSAARRAEVQTRMLSAEVLDVERFPEIAFASTAIEAAAPARWRVTGRLTIHGQVRSVTFPVTLTDDRYRGEVAIKQRDFGIQPIKVAGGTVRVKDEITVQFDIAR